MLRLLRYSLPVLLLLWGGFSPLWAEEKKLGDTRQTLKEIEQRIAKTAESLAEKQAQEKALGSDLKTVEKELDRLRQRLGSQETRLAALKQEIAGAEQDAGARKKMTQQLQAQVARRLSALYKGGEVGLLRAFFESGSPARMAEDYAYLGRIVRADRELLADYRVRLAHLEEGLQKLGALRQEQEALVAAGRKDQESLNDAARVKKKLLGKVQKDKGKIAANLAELKERAARLSGLVKKLESAQTQGYSGKPTAFSGQKGRLPWPFQGKVKVPFGANRDAALGTLYESNGIEIAAAPNLPIKAVWEGKVVFANWFKGYGNLMIVDHGGSYFTLYAQAARLEKRVGESVKKGETVGLSGYEGNDVVYFEIRHRGTPLNPAAWLSPR